MLSLHVPCNTLEWYITEYPTSHLYFLDIHLYIWQVEYSVVYHEKALHNSFLYNNQINARALIGQSAMVYCASKLMEISRVFWILLNTRRIHKSLACGSWFTNSSRVLPTSRVVYQPIKNCSRHRAGGGAGEKIINLVKYTSKSEKWFFGGPCVRFSEQTRTNIRAYFRAKWRLLFIYHVTDNT